MTRRSMKLTLMAGAAACIFSGPAFANDWEGLSLGIGGGYGMANSRFRDSATVSGSTLSETSNGIPGSGGLFTLSAGYDHALLGTLVVGGFIDYDFADIGSRSFYELGNQLSVGGRLGYLVAPTTLFFSIVRLRTHQFIRRRSVFWTWRLARRYWKLRRVFCRQRS